MVKTVEHQSNEERAASGKAARAVLPREQLAEWKSGPAERWNRWTYWLSRPEPGCPSWCPSVTPGWPPRPSPTTGGRRCRWPPTSPLQRSPASWCSCAATPTWRTSAGSPLPSGSSSSTSTTLTRPLPGPFEWDLKRLAASLEVAARGRAFDSRTARTITLAGIRAYQQAIRDFAGMSNLDVWYARLDVNGVIQRWGGGVRCQAGERIPAQRRQSFVQRPDKGPSQTHSARRRRPALRVRSASARSGGGTLRAGRRPGGRRVDPRNHPKLPTDPAR